MPGLLDKAVRKITASGVKESSAWPMAVAAMQKAGNLKAGSLEATKQGKARNKMTPAQRAKNPP